MTILQAPVMCCALSNCSIVPVVGDVGSILQMVKLRLREVK
jgi:hypothetical protein